MNSLDSEYSFLAPTWRLPPVGTPSMYPASYDTSDSPSIPKLAPDEVGKIKLTKKLCFFFSHL